MREVYSLAVLETRVWNHWGVSRPCSSRRLWGRIHLACSGPWWLPGLIGLWLYHSQLCFLFYLTLLSCVSSPFFPFFLNILFVYSWETQRSRLLSRNLMWDSIPGNHWAHWGFPSFSFLSPLMTPVIGFRVHTNPGWSHLESLTLITFPDIPNKVTFWGSK